MPTLIIIIVLSILLFLMYQMKAYRSKEPLIKKFNAAKGNIAIGVFFIAFGVNRLFLHPNTVALVISGLFILYGVYITYSYISRSRFFYDQLRQSTQSNNH